MQITTENTYKQQKRSKAKFCVIRVLRKSFKKDQKKLFQKLV